MKPSFIEVLIKLVFGFDVMDSCLKLLFSLRNAFKKIGIQFILIEARVGAGAYIGGGGGYLQSDVFWGFLGTREAYIKWTFYKGVKA